MSEDSSGIGCFKGCGIGCGCLILLFIGIAVLGSFTVMRSFNRAVESRTQLEEVFGGQENYSPTPDGAISEDRIALFLEVREAMGDQCAKISDISDQMLAMEAFDGQDEPSKVAIMQQAMKTTQAAMSMAPTMGGFFETRNRKLLEIEMGLGEYTYIYVMAYHHHLTEELAPNIFDDRPVNRRVHGALLNMLEQQRSAQPTLAEAPQGATDLDVEIAKMEADSARIPWQDGLPQAISLSVEPFRVLLEEGFCAPAVSIELLRNKKRALAIESE